jgi:hypothetical protein
MTVASNVKMGSDCFLARARHLKVGITGLSDITLRMEVQCRSKCCAHVRESPLLKAKNGKHTV